MHYKNLLDETNIKINKVIGEVRLKKITATKAIKDIEEIKDISVTKVLELDQFDTKYLVVVIETVSNNRDDFIGNAIPKIKAFQESSWYIKNKPLIKETGIDINGDDAFITLVISPFINGEEIKFIEDLYLSNYYNEFKPEVSIKIREAK